MPRQRIIKFQTSPCKQPYLIIGQILDGFIKRVNYLSDKYSQISVCHMTISLPITPDTVAAKVVGICLTCLRKKLKYMGMESQCGWVKEISLNEHEHFHVGFIWNSSKIQSAIRIGNMLNEILTDYLRLPAHYRCVNVNPPNPLLDRQFDQNICSNKTIKLCKKFDGFEEQKINIINWFSYLAKLETKGNHQSKHIREFAFSLCYQKENEKCNSTENK